MLLKLHRCIREGSMFSCPQLKAYHKGLCIERGQTDRGGQYGPFLVRGVQSYSRQYGVCRICTALLEILIQYILPLVGIGSFSMSLLDCGWSESDHVATIMPDLSTLNAQSMRQWPRPGSSLDTDACRPPYHACPAAERARKDTSPKEKNILFTI